MVVKSDNMRYKYTLNDEGLKIIGDHNFNNNNVIPYTILNQYTKSSFDLILIIGEFLRVDFLDEARVPDYLKLELTLFDYYNERNKLLGLD